MADHRLPGVSDRHLDHTVIVLTGGTGRRLGGVDKAALVLGPDSLLDTLLASLDPEAVVVVAGDERPASRPVRFCREDPPGGGPAAGVAAAVAHVDTPLVGVVAVDMPWAAPVLRSALDLLQQGPADAVVPVDSDGRHQYLCMAWRTEALRHAISRAGDLHGRPVRDLLDGVDARELALPDGDERLQDIDTPEDLRRAREGMSRT